MTTSLCHIGSKSLSHILSYIERTKDTIIPLSQQGPAAKLQIITSVVTHWRDVQPGVAVNIIDKLLNYGILDPRSVVQWALGTPSVLLGGRALAQSWVLEIVDRTVGKVANRVRQIVAARRLPGQPAEQVAELDRTLAEERDGMRELFGRIGDALVGVAEGAEERMMEEEDPAVLEILRDWGIKWRRMYARKLAVEEVFVNEAAKQFPPPMEEKVNPMPEDGANGDAMTGVNGGTADGVNGDAQIAGDDDLIS